MDSPRILLIADEDAEAIALHRLLADSVSLHWLDNDSSLGNSLNAYLYDAILCGWTIGDRTWREVLREVKQTHPQLPVLIFSRTASEEDWIEVLMEGGFDLLVSPFTKASMGAA